MQNQGNKSNTKLRHFPFPDKEIENGQEKENRELVVWPAGRPPRAVHKAGIGLSKYQVFHWFHKVSRHDRIPCTE